MKNKILSSLKHEMLKEKEFFKFLSRFTLTYCALFGIYQLYLKFTVYNQSLDWVTYSVSELSFYLAQLLGVTNCTFSCFIEGCYVGQEGKLIHIAEGCNGLSLAIAYGAFIIGYSNINWKTLLQILFGLLTIQSFNVLRIGILIVLRDFGGDAYFYFIKYLFGTVIYASIFTLWWLQPQFNKWLN
jgi:exosortase family protein XrtF